MFFLHPVFLVHIVFVVILDHFHFLWGKIWLDIEQYWKKIPSPPSFSPPEMTSTSRCCRPLWSCMSSQTSTSYKHYGQRSD